MPVPYFVYILTNQSGCYYVGMTRDMLRRWHEHRDGLQGAVFTRRFHVTRLVNLVSCVDYESARRHAASLKRRSRARKAATIRQHNPAVRDLAVVFGWREAPPSSGS